MPNSYFIANLMLLVEDTTHNNMTAANTMLKEVKGVFNIFDDGLLLFVL